MVPSRLKGIDDVLLGHTSFDEYVDDKYFGVTVGRFANRIAGGKFTLAGKEYSLCKNHGENSLHGGKLSFSRKVWKAESYEEKDGVFVRFELKSPDGEEGYPGNLKAAVSYGLTKSNEIVADYQASVDAQCPINLTNHAYFNLSGENRGIKVLSTEVKLYCSSYLEIDAALIPTGRILPTDNTPLDFRAQKPIGKDIDVLIAESKQQGGPEGYDHCFVINGENGKLRPFAEAYDPFSGRRMSGFTTQPAFQFFTGSNLISVKGKLGAVYEKYDGFFMFTQHFPDSPNKSDFSSTIFGPSRDYNEKAVFAFDW
jgi:aldose 1-epimerase